MAKGLVPRYLSGTQFILSGYRTIMADKKLKRLAVIPLAINFIMFVVALWWGGGKTSDWTAKALGAIFTEPEGFWYNLMYYPLTALFFVAFVVVAVYAIYFIGSIIAAPFNSMLAEAVLLKNGVITERPFHIRSWASLTIRMTLISVMKAIVLGSVGLLIFIASFIPGVNVVAAFVAFMILAFDLMDYSLEMMELSLVDRFKYFRRHKVHFAGMATVLSVTILIPGLTFLILPCAVAGASEVAHQIQSTNN